MKEYISKQCLQTLMCLRGISYKTVLAMMQTAENCDESVMGLADLRRFVAQPEIQRLKKMTAEEVEEAYGMSDEATDKLLTRDIAILSYYDEAYPKGLRGLVRSGKPASPVLLYCKGNIEVLGKPSVSVVGTRTPTAEAYDTTLQMSQAFASAGLNIVSGLALGCDTAAHKGALLAKNGQTTAVLANDLTASVYPAENQSLANEIIAKGGVLVSEYAYRHEISQWSFIERDRLQAGLSVATLVTAGRRSSGARHAIDTAKENNRPALCTRFSKDFSEQQSGMFDFGDNCRLVDIGDCEKLATEFKKMHPRQK